MGTREPSNTNDLRLYLSSMKSVVVGTAGHIDHGKTALVKALTGMDADRLEEEKRRGITIDIGFAHLELPGPDGDKIRLGFVDVPGHERFVRNMLAGVAGVDLVLLAIAADEGIKPQTREHFDICRMLSIPRGITVLTKADAVDPETLDVVRLEVEEFLRGSFLDPVHAPIVPVSALTGVGIEDLKRALVRQSLDIAARDSSAITRLPIDRVFTMKGFGTVVTGTLISGAIEKELELEVFPSGQRVRVRGIQVHGCAAEKAYAGQRTALNLAGASIGDLARGMMLAPPGTFRASNRIDVSLALLHSAKPLKDRAQVHLHAYTSEVIAEVRLYRAKQVAPGEQVLAHLRMEEPGLLLPGDRFIIRQFSPVITIGGGIVLDASPQPKAKKDVTESFLGVLLNAGPETALQARVARRAQQALSISEAVAESGLPANKVENALSKPVQSGGMVRIGELFIDRPALDSLKQLMQGSVEHFHSKSPLVAGMSRKELQESVGVRAHVFSAALDALVKEQRLEVVGEVVRLPGRAVVMKDEEAESKAAIEQAFASAGLAVPALKDVLASLKVDRTRAQKIVTLLLRDKVLVKISDDLVFHRTALDQLRQQVAVQKAKSPNIDVSQFKDLTGVSRKYAIPLLEYLDRERVTRRVGNARIIL